MAAALQDDGGAASLLVAAPAGSQATVPATGHAGAGALGVAANRDDDDGAVGEQLVDKDLADGVAGYGAEDFFARDTAAPFPGLGAPYSRAGAVGERLVDNDLAGVLGGRAAPFAVVYKDLGSPLLDKDHGDLLARDTAAPFAGVTLGKPLAMAGAGAAPSSPNAGQISVDVVMDGKVGVPSAAAAGADAISGSLDSAVVGIVSASTAVTMFAAGTVSPPLAFGLFVLLLGGLSLVVSAVRGA